MRFQVRTISPVKRGTEPGFKRLITISHQHRGFSLSLKENRICRASNSVAVRAGLRFESKSTLSPCSGKSHRSVSCVSLFFLLFRSSCFKKLPGASNPFMCLVIPDMPGRGSPRVRFEALQLSLYDCEIVERLASKFDPIRAVGCIMAEV